MKDTAELIERLMANAKKAADCLGHIGITLESTIEHQAASRLFSLQAENDRLREALNPFAAESENCSWLESVDDDVRYSSFIDANDHYPGGEFTIGDLRRARSALNEAGQ